MCHDLGLQKIFLLHDSIAYFFFQIVSNALASTTSSSATAEPESDLDHQMILSSVENNPQPNLVSNCRS